MSDLREKLKLNMARINLIHVLVIGSLLMYIGKSKDKTPKWAFQALGVLALLIFLLVPAPSNLDINYWNMVHVLHYLVILPVLLYISYHQKVPPEQYENIFTTGLVIVVYHAYKAYQKKDMLF